MFVRNMGMYPLLFFVFWVVFGLIFDILISNMAMKLCRGNERRAKTVVIAMVSLFSYILVRMIGPPIVDFLDWIFRTEFHRGYN